MSSMLVEAEIWTVARTDQGNAVLVRPLGSEVAVPIFIGQLETQSILIGLGHVPMPRPLTHDLFITLMKSLETKLERVEITALKEGTFFSQIVLKQGDQEISLDTRPSDAMGIAVRVGCSIFISETVVDEAGIPINTIADPGDEPLEPGAEEDQSLTELERLEEELRVAVEKEQYEEAALLRDRIKELSEDDPKTLES